MKLGPTLRSYREKSGIGPIKTACATLGVSHGSLGAYEREETLPDVDFLAKFAEVTGAPFIELLKLRLAASGAPESARAIQLLNDGLSERTPPPSPPLTRDTAHEVDQELLIEIFAKLLKKRLESIDFGIAAVRIYTEYQAAIQEALRAVRSGELPEGEAFVPLVKKLQGQLMHTTVTHAALVAIIYNEVVGMGSESARTQGIDRRVASWAATLDRALGDGDGEKDQPSSRS